MGAEQCSNRLLASALILQKIHLIIKIISYKCDDLSINGSNLAMISETTSQSAGSSELKLGPALASSLACWLRSSSLFWITLL